MVWPQVFTGSAMAMLWASLTEAPVNGALSVNLFIDGPPF
jgi:hypothetical protein